MQKVELKKKRHIAKTLTWRLIGTLDTFLISTFLIHYLNDSSYLDSAVIGGWISGLEIVTKMILYYLHERFWYTVNWISSHQLRHIVKTVSWRLVGAIDTVMLVFLVFYFTTGNIKRAPEIAISMFSIEIVTKMILYYFHERIWYASNWGVIKPKN